MAGDWIKLQVATPHKPEVLRMAEVLGVPRREMVGILVDFLCWLDTNARHADVTHVSRKCLDDVLACTGLSAVLELVGWVKWDDAACLMTVSNYDRHNGESSKNRALATERKRIQRSRECHEENVTREEKRRDTTAKAVVQQPRKSLDEPSPEHLRIAEERGVSCLAEFQKYRDWQASTGKRHKDEAAGFRNWLKNARPLGTTVSLAERRAANMAAITGQVKREREVFADGVGAKVIPALPSDLGEPGGDDVGGRAAERAYRDVG
jgi:hypothetical protein